LMFAEHPETAGTHRSCEQCGRETGSGLRGIFRAIKPLSSGNPG
jgi:hypothetical protein